MKLMQAKINFVYHCHLMNILLYHAEYFTTSLWKLYANHKSMILLIFQKWYCYLGTIYVITV